MTTTPDTLAKLADFHAWMDREYPDRLDRQGKFRMSSVQSLMEASWLAALTAQALPAAEPATIPDNTQNWAGMDGAIAWHLIDRHADGWGDVGKMMSEWLAANQAAQQAAQATAAPKLDTDTLRPLVARLALEIDPEAVLETLPEALAFQIDMARAVIRAALPQPQPQSAQSKGDAA